MAEVQIAGAAMTRFGKFATSTIRSLSEEAVAAALADAGIAARDVDAVFFGNAAAGLLTGQEMIRGQVALRNTGLLGVPIANVENACATAATAFHLAVTAVHSEVVDIALAVGAEKLTHVDKRRSFAALSAAVDLFAFSELSRTVPVTQESAAPIRRPKLHSVFMDVYAATTRAYLARSDAKPRDFAEVAVKNHRHAALNPKAQSRERVTVEQVLGSPVVAAPLTMLMCSPIGDGAAAIVVCSARRAKALGAARVRVRACALVSGTTSAVPGSRVRAAAHAYEQAGVGPSDIDVLELHDAAAPAELIGYEHLGLCGQGEGAALLRSGATRLGGAHVVNPSGGLLAKGHPIGATGCGQLVELADQLRGRCGPRQVPGARVALAENGGGLIGEDAAATVVTVLST
ncbi:thiolase [Prauserella marina]|uniref:propanoyl-CoA C-acyltransferase n=1 Tax=Prauserella marina TaxID=530584 RepID=A0A222VTA3_9PSEU|nr:thiolase family protein [Prauserella marina]ASR37138.1 thiolase [Prauserella marina]PWV72444.1 acetyl-CoA acetyltransferase [Prauserella marina]SDD79914.1 Acetyl-CoA acetyltransferase [Prauserella marina]